MFLTFRSSLTLSIQVFLCLPLLLFPSTCPCKATFGNLFSSIPSTCPSHCNLLFLIFCIPLFLQLQALLLFVHFRLYSNPSSCKSFLVSCQVVTNPLLVGQGGRWVPKDLFRPKVSFQHMPPALASFSGFLVSLSTSRSALRGSSVSDLHP